MQAKDFTVMAAIAIVAGATAGIAGGMIRGADTSDADANAALTAQLDKIESRLAATLDELKESRTELADLKDRVSAAELAARDVQQAFKDAGGTLDGESPRPGRARRTASITGPDGKELPVGTRRIRLGDGEKGGFSFSTGGEDGEGDVEMVLGSPEIQGELTKAMQGITNSFRLRGMPEEKRWEKAREELGLNDGQIETLKQAVAARDAAMKDSMKIEQESNGTDGSRITIRGMDPEKAQVANKAYEDKVNETLDENQRKGWNEKGYSHAFGRGPMGGNAIMIATDMRIDGSQGGTRDGAEKPAK